MNTIAFIPSLGVPEIVIIPFFVAWVWAILDCLLDKRKSKGDKVSWVLALILLNILAAIVYWVLKLVAKKSSNKSVDTAPADAPR